MGEIVFQLGVEAEPITHSELQVRNALLADVRDCDCSQSNDHATHADSQGNLPHRSDAFFVSDDTKEALICLANHATGAMEPPFSHVSG